MRRREERRECFERGLDFLDPACNDAAASVMNVGSWECCWISGAVSGFEGAFERLTAGS